MDWAAIRAEYLAGGIGQAALAQKHGVKPGALKRLAKEEGWTALRREGDAVRGDGAIAARIRGLLLQKLEHAAQVIPCDATEVKTTDEDGAVKLLKLRDLTAAYRELVGDGSGGDGDGADRVIIDL